MRYLFRSPIYPVILKVGPGAVCSATPKDLESYLKRNATKLPDECALIDYQWEGWTLYPKESIVSPMTLTKRYTKREFLLFCGISEEQLARGSPKRGMETFNGELRSRGRLSFLVLPPR